MAIRTQTLDQHIASCVLCCATEGLSPKTIDWYSANLRRFRDYLKWEGLARGVTDIGTSEARRIKTQDVINLLFHLFIFRGITEHLRSDNGPEFTAKAIRAWLNRVEVKILIEQWRKEYNQVRPHSSLGYRPPAPEAVMPVTLT